MPLPASENVSQRTHRLVTQVDAVQAEPPVERQVALARSEEGHAQPALAAVGEELLDDAPARVGRADRVGRHERVAVEVA